MEQRGKPLSRRGLLRTAGLAAAGAPPAGSAAVQDPGKAGKRALRVRVVERPALAETNADFGRFSGVTIGGLYEKLKTERDGQGSLKTERDANARRTMELMRDGKPGFSLRDRQLTSGAWTLMGTVRPGAGLLSWTRISVRTPGELGVAPCTASPQEMADMVKAAARLYGASIVGIAPMKEAYVNLKEGKRAIVFEDVDLPAATEEKLVIPRKMKWVVAVAIQANLGLLSRAPSAVGEGATGLGYSQCAFTVASLAEFIFGLGYQAIPSVSDTAQCVPFAVDAGLGELGRMNRLLTPEFGPAVRLAKVFTDMPMACDKPIDFGVTGFCRQCKRCAQACPAQSLSFDDEPSFKTRGPWNNPGHKAWFDDAYLCNQYSQTVGGNVCSLCVAVCPHTKAAESWTRETVKATTSRIPNGGGFFRIMDDAFGYCRQRDPREWWKHDPPASGRRG